MKKRSRITITSLAAIVWLAVFLLILTPALLRAATAGDADVDGLPDTVETTVVNASLSSQSWSACTKGTQRDDCVDVNTKDLFYILWPSPYSNPQDTLDPASTADSLIPSSMDVMAFLKQGEPAWGVHRINLSDDATNPIEDRNVYSGSAEMAMRFSEDATSPLETDGALGLTVWGTPQSTSDSTIYSQRIADWVYNELNNNSGDTICFKTTTSKSAAYCSTDTYPSKWPAYCSAGQQSPVAEFTGLSNPSFAQCLYDALLLHIFAHEAGHNMKLAPTYNAAYGGNHYAPSTSPTIMDQCTFGVFNPKNLTWTLYIGDKYNAKLDTPVLTP